MRISHHFQNCIIMSAAVAIYIPLALSFFSRSLFFETACHRQLFYRPDTSGDSAAEFSCTLHPNIEDPLAVFPLYAELQIGTEKGVFSNKMKLFFAEETSSNVWNRTYYKLNETSSLLITTQNSEEASILRMVTEPNSEIHSPGGRFHFEYHTDDNTAITCPNATRKLKLCAKMTTQNECGPHHLVAKENCGSFGLISGLLAPLYQFPMNHCYHIYHDL